VEITSCGFISGTVLEITWNNLRTLGNKSRVGLYLTPKKALHQIHMLHNLLNKTEKIHTAFFPVRKPRNLVSDINIPEKYTACI